MQANKIALNKGRKVTYDRYGYLFIAPFFIVFLIFQLYPIFFTFRTSLTDTVGAENVLKGHIIGFDNFKLLFTPNPTSERFWLSFKNTLIIWFFNFVPQIAFALILASWFNDKRLRLHGQGAYKVLIFMPNIITAATIAMLFYSFFNFPIAPVNTLLQKFGIVNMPVRFMRNVSTARGLISFIQWWMWYGNTMIIMLAGMTGINPSLFEAAMIDGCTSRQIFWKITLPLIKPIMLYNLVTSLVGGLTMFDIPHLMTQGEPRELTNTVARFIYTQGFMKPNNYNIASAASVVLFIIIIIGSLIINMIMKDRSAGVPKAKKGARV